MSAEDDRSTRDLVIGLVSDVRHLREQLDKVLKLEDRMLACEKDANSAKDFASRLVWLTAGLAAGVVALILAVVPRLLK